MILYLDGIDPLDHPSIILRAELENKTARRVSLDSWAVDWISKEPPKIIDLEGPRFISNISKGHFSIHIEYPERILDRLNVTVLTKHQNSAEWTSNDVEDVAINVSSGKWEFDIVPSSAALLGNHSVKVVLTDFWGDQVEQTFPDKFVVYNVNDPPTIKGSPRKNCYEDNLYDLQPEVFDLDPDDIHTWTMDTDAPFLSLDPSTGYLSGIPKNSDIGSYFVGLTVTDLGGLTDTLNFTFSVVNVNDPPQILTDFPAELEEDSPFELKLEAIDIDPSDDLLLWSMRTNVSFLTLKRYEGVLKGTPRNNHVGPFYIVINVSDGVGGYDEKNFSSRVVNTNDPPVLGAPPDRIEFYEDTIYQIDNFQAWFLDEDFDILDVQHSAPQNFHLTSTEKGGLMIRPLRDWNGEEVITFSASDNEYMVECEVAFKVLPVNDAPINISIAIEKMRYRENERIVISGYAEDVDIVYGDQLTYHWFKRGGSPLGKGMMQEFYLEKGEYEIVLNVTDKKGAGIETSVTIEVYKERSFMSAYGTFLIIIAVVSVLAVLLAIGLLIYRRMSRPEAEEPPTEGPPIGSHELLALGAADGYSSSLVGGGQLQRPALEPFMKQPEELPQPVAALREPAGQLPPAVSMTADTSGTSVYVRPYHDQMKTGVQTPIPQDQATQNVPDLPFREGEVYPAVADTSNPPTVSSVIDQMIMENKQPFPTEAAGEGEMYPQPEVEPQFNSPVWTPEVVEARMKSEARSAVEILHELNELRMEGAITEEEFQTYKKRLLRKI